MEVIAWTILLRRRTGRFGWLACSLLTMLALQALLLARSPLIAPDGVTFIAVARRAEQNLAAAIAEHDQHLGYPLMVLFVKRVAGALLAHDAVAWTLAARLAVSGCGLMCVVVIWLLAKHLFDDRVANVSAALLAITPVFLQNASDALSDAPHLLFYLLAVLFCCWAMTEPRKRWFFLVGATSGVAFWIRPEGLSIAIVSGTLLLASAALSAEQRRLRIQHGLLVFLGAALVVSPYVLVTGQVTKKLTSKVGWRELRSRLWLPHGDEAAQSPASLVHQVPPTASPAEAAPPGPVESSLSPLSLSLRKLGKAGGAFCVRFAECERFLLLLPLLIGIPVSMRRLNPGTEVLYWGWSLFHIFLALLLFFLGGYLSRRHLLPLVGLLVPLVSLGGVCLLDWINGRFARARWRYLATATLGLAVFLALAPRCLRPLHESQLNTLTAAQWIDREASPGDGVLSNSSLLLYYCSPHEQARRHCLLQPPGRLDNCLDRGIQFVVLEIGCEQYDEAWLEQLPNTYQPVAAVTGSKALGQRDLIIYRAAPIRSENANPEYDGASMATER